MIRRALAASAAIMGLLLGGVGVGVAEAAPLKPLRLASYTVAVLPPVAPAFACTYNFINCGFVAVTATFSGLDRAPWRPTDDQPGPPQGNLSGTTDVSRVYGCADAAGKRLRSDDRTVTETVNLNTRQGTGLRFPATGDTVTATTYAFLDDHQPGQCPAGTTAMTYKIVASHTRLELDSYLDGFATGTYRAPARAQWIGAVAAPVTVTVTP